MVWLAIPLALASSMVIVSYREWTHWLDAREQNVHHRAILGSIGAVRLAFAEMKSGQRGFLLTGDPNHLASYTIARNRVAGLLASVHKELPANSTLAGIDALTAGAMAEFSRPIQLKREGQSVRADQAFLHSSLARQLGRVEGLLDIVSNREANYLAHSTHLLLVARTRAGWLSTVGCGMIFAFLLLATALIHRSTIHREALISNLEKSRSETEAAQENIATSERLYRYLFERNPQPMWIYDLSTLSFLAVNDSALGDYGYAREEFLAMTIRDIRPEEDIPDLMANIDSAHGDERWHSGPWRHKPKSGELLYVMVTSQPINFEGRPARFVAVYDVTGQKEADEARRVAEERLKLAVEAAGIGSYDWDLTNGTLTWSDQCKAMFGLAPNASLTYDVFKGLLHPDDVASVESEVQHALEPAGLGHFESVYRNLRADGSIRWISSRGEVFFVVRNGKRQPEQFLGCVIDITERMNAEGKLQAVALREKEARETAELLNRIGPIVLTELNQQKLVQAITDLSTQLTGAQCGCFCYNQLDEKGALVLQCASCKSPGFSNSKTTLAFMETLFSPMFKHGRAIRVEDVTTHPDFAPNLPDLSVSNGLRPVRSFMAVPVCSRTKDVLGALVFEHQDAAVFDERVERIAQGIASQAGLAFDNARLFETVRRERSNVERHATELASTNADLRQFAYSVSHDLQEPLRTVGVYGELLQQRLLGRAESEINDYLQFVLQGTRQMKDLIADMLAYMEIISGDELRPEQVDANQVLQQVRAALRATIAESHASISSGFLPLINIPKVHLHQLLQNLLGNALKYKGSNRPAIHVWAEQQGEWWQFSVQDNGVGIPPQYADQIFGIFKRLHGQAYPGTGMGLAICKRVVERYGGRIWVDANTGAGATFRFTLPAK